MGQICLPGLVTADLLEINEGHMAMALKITYNNPDKHQ